jgi:hypothetical protein
MVALPGPGGFQVPARFTIQMHSRVRRTPVSAEVAVEMVDGEPHVRALALGVRGSEARPLSAADLSAISLKDLLDSAVVRTALEHTPMRWEPGDDGPVSLGAFTGWVREQQAADEGAALTAARASRDRRRITPDDLRRVLAIHAAKGVEGIMGELGYSERNARRLLARARKELRSEP